MRVDVYVDVLCPWCFIGKRRLDAALAGLDERSCVQTRWRSYELDPHASRIPGATAAEHMAEPDWWGDRAPAKIAHIRSVGAAEALELNLHLARPVNTFDAHRLSHWAAIHGRADAVMERLFLAYHTEGLNIADLRVLERLGVEAGLDATEARAVLASDAYALEVRADERRGYELGVTSVPTLVIGSGTRVSGVQPSAALRRQLQDAVTAIRDSSPGQRERAPQRRSGLTHRR
ncbi:DsbA family protein [Micromonospora sp. NBC_01412]|uniref:DsbA family oxidoreductase n=1 Tax=Micromonospora sp. NBC_01412 TaxID=2903590 RepID=UPI003253C65A